MTRPFSRRPARPTAFTLVELLVVIGIIALLISILLPSLQAARESAAAAKCLSNQRQTAVALVLWITDHKGKSLPSRTGGLQQFADLDQGGYLNLTDNPQIQLCPSASELPEVGTFMTGFANTRHGTANFGWVLNKTTQPDAALTPEQVELSYSAGSYGWNGWITYVPPNSADTGDWTNGHRAAFFYRRESGRDELFYNSIARATTETPIIGDAVWGEAFPFEFTVPADEGNEVLNPWPWASAIGIAVPSGSVNAQNGNINRYHIARHNDGVNVAFSDGHAEPVRDLLELWSLKWHQDWDPNLLPDFVKDELNITD